MAPKIVQRAPKIGQVAPKGCQNLKDALAFFTTIFFFDFLVRLGAKKIDFGSPLALSWSPNGAQNHPSGAKKSPKSCQKGSRKYNPSHYFAPLETSTKKNIICWHSSPPCFRVRFRSVPLSKNIMQMHLANHWTKTKKNTNPNIQRLNETMIIFSKTSSAIHPT